MKYLLIFLVWISFPNLAKSQTKLPKLDELNIASSPAFVLLDESPANIEKPTNPKEFAISLFNTGTNGGAIETTPYWLVDHPAYSFTDDVANHFPISQTFAISLASIKGNDTTTISAGFRVQLFRKYNNEKEILEIKNKIQELLSERDPLKIDMAKITIERDKLDAERGRIKYNLELAGAYSALGENYKNLSGNKLGIWANFKYTPMADSFFDIVALARYSKILSNTDQTSEPSFLDFGGALSRQGSKYDIQIEYVYRRDTKLNTSHDRLAFIANYQIIPGLVAVASFGKNFDTQNDIFTAFGVKFGLLNRTNND